jgi:phenolic acid decarboxylase
VPLNAVKVLNRNALLIVLYVHRSKFSVNIFNRNRLSMDERLHQSLVVGRWVSSVVQSRVLSDLKLSLVNISILVADSRDIPSVFSLNGLLT